MSTRITPEATTLADQLHSQAIHLLRRLRREDARSGLNAQRLSALSVLVFSGPMTLGELAAAEQVRPPTMTRIVDALVEQALVVRKRNEDDARSTVIRATAAGRTLLGAARERRVRALALKISELAREDRSALRRAADILAELVRVI